MQYRASGAAAAAWGAAPSHAAAAAVAAAAAYPPYTRYPSAAAAAAAAAQVPVGAQPLPPSANPYATAPYAQHVSVSTLSWRTVFFSTSSSSSFSSLFISLLSIPRCTISLMLSFSLFFFLLPPLHSTLSLRSISIAVRFYHFSMCRSSYY